MGKRRPFCSVLTVDSTLREYRRRLQVSIQDRKIAGVRSTPYTSTCRGGNWVGMYPALSSCGVAGERPPDTMSRNKVPLQDRADTLKYMI